MDLPDKKWVTYCPHCGNDAPQVLVGNCSKVVPRDSSHHYFLLQCQTCSEVLLYRQLDWRQLHSIGAIERFETDDFQLVWPRLSVLDVCVPFSVQKIYSEASRIKLHSPNGFAGLIRRAMEAICNDRNAEGRNLATKLKNLADRGEIPTTLSEISTVLRKLGNIGVHEGEEDIPQEYVVVIDDFFRVIVEYVYTARIKVEEFKQQLNAVNISN
ncbi:DUF4145 domain-containing protein [Schlesneria sp. T3-172]|uniref:DUF4145 domain-containing protein n=1 Tax=Schlesneria sphaerica TaxID=3373610 RepID=UPI0037CBB84B